MTPRSVGPSVDLPPAPEGLSEDSRAAWAQLVTDLRTLHNASTGNLLRLEGALRARDRLVEVRRELGRQDLMVVGSQGQQRPHPLLVLEAKLRHEVATTLASLGVAASPRYPSGARDDGSMWDRALS